MDLCGCGCRGAWQLALLRCPSDFANASQLRSAPTCALATGLLLRAHRVLAWSSWSATAKPKPGSATRDQVAHKVTGVVALTSMDPAARPHRLRRPQCPLLAEFARARKSPSALAKSLGGGHRFRRDRESLASLDECHPRPHFRSSMARTLLGLNGWPRSLT